jgi:type II secretory pathway pseudopilin PulG
MSRPALIAAAAALVVATMPAVPAQAQNWSARAAESQCRDQLRRQYRVSNTHSVTTSDRGNGRFQVNGNADRDRQTANFNCRVEYGNVRNLNVGSWRNQSNNGGGDALAAVGVAVALGAIIAAASSKKKSHEYDQYPDGYQGNDYNNDSYSPASGITCYRQQRACFDNYNNYNAGWTSRQFGY